MSLYNLLQNERMKLYKKPSTWIIISVIAGLTSVMLVFIGIGSRIGEFWDGYSWEDQYKSQLQYEQYNQKEADPTIAIPAKYQVEKLQYLLDNEIPPEDWRTDIADYLWGAQGEAALCQWMLTQTEYEPEYAELEQAVADAQAEAAKWQAILDSGDWKTLIRQRLEDVDNDSSLSTEKEKEARREVLQLQLELEIEPISLAGYYSPFVSADSQWRTTELQQVEDNKLSLLRGEQNGMALTSTQRKNIETQIEVSLERLRTDTAPLDMTTFGGLMDFSTSSLELIAIVLVVIAGGLIAGECSTGTVKLLLITPHKRSKIFWSKALLMLEVAAIIAGAMLVLSFLISGLLTGFKGIGDMQVVALFGGVRRLPYLLYVLLKYVVFLLPVLTYGAMALMLSAVTRKNAVAVAISLLLIYGSEMVMTVLVVLSQVLGMTIPGVRFLLFSNVGLAQYFPSVSFGGIDTGTLMVVDGTMTLGFSVCVLLVYMACFLWIARDSFCRRDIK